MRLSRKDIPGGWNSQPLTGKLICFQTESQSLGFSTSFLTFPAAPRVDQECES